MVLAGRVAIVTGGGKGIGAAFSSGMAAQGASVVIADIDDPAAQAVTSLIRSQGGYAVHCAVDVADPIATKEMAAVVIKAFGGIDILVNNAAMYANLKRRPFLEITPEEFDRVLSGM